MSFYVATLLALIWSGFPFQQWSGLISVTVATIGTLALREKEGWDLGLVAPPLTAARELLGGTVLGATLVAAAALAIIWTSALHHVAGRGFPWMEVALVYLPAVLHEELLFRGYPFQKLLRWNRAVAILLIALVFAALHTGNSSVTLLGLGNVFLGGVLLGLGYERHGRLWFPIGIHLAWNVMAGPILGHEVSGYVPDPSVLAEAGSGAWWITGGAFGIEGSVWMTVMESVGIALLLARRPARGSGSPPPYPRFQ